MDGTSGSHLGSISLGGGGGGLCLNPLPSIIMTWVKFVSLNVNELDLAQREKRKKIFIFLKHKNADIIMLHTLSKSQEIISIFMKCENSDQSFVMVIYEFFFKFSVWFFKCLEETITCTNYLMVHNHF